MITKNNIIIILSAVVLFLVTFLVWQRQAIRDLKERPVYYAEYDTTIVENIVSDTIYPAPVTLVETVYQDRFSTDTILIPVDTAAILADYYAERTYSDVLLDNDTIFLLMEEVIALNRLKTRYFEYELTIPERTVHHAEYYEQARRKLFFNSDLMFNKVEYGIQAELIFIDLHEHMFSVGAGYFYDKPFFTFGFGAKF